jgi:hypothetical protein
MPLFFISIYHFVQVPAKSVNPTAVDALEMIPLCVLDPPLKFLHVLLALSAYVLVHIFNIIYNAYLFRCVLYMVVGSVLKYSVRDLIR